MSMGDALHYHGVGEERYCHRHTFLSIFHDHHDEASESANRIAGVLLHAIGMTEPAREDTDDA